MEKQHEVVYGIVSHLVAMEEDETLSSVKAALDSGIPPGQVIEQGLAPGLAEVGKLFEQGKYFLPDLMIAGKIMESCMVVLTPLLKNANASQTGKGRILLATVKGDIHDIGKNIVATMLVANGFEVVDLGRDVDALTIVRKAEELSVDAIGLSALLTTSMPYFREVIKILREKGVREKYPVVVGGGAVTADYANQIGANAYGTNAAAATAAFSSVIRKVNS
jgi:corrinoid protein of di/trimethylamine methyltransferase